MGNYRDELVRKLKASGQWDDFPAAFQASVARITDEQACELLAGMGEAEVNEKALLDLVYSKAPLPEAPPVVAAEPVADEPPDLGGVLQGKLLAKGGKGLSELGQALARLYRAAEEAGVSPGELALGLTAISHPAVRRLLALSGQGKG